MGCEKPRMLSARTHTDITAGTAEKRVELSVMALQYCVSIQVLLLPFVIKVK